MERDGPLHLPNKILTIVALAGLAACARSAPSLPSSAVVSEASLSPREQAMSCEDVDARLAENKQEASRLNGLIAANRGGNQAIGYVAAAAFPPLALAAESNSTEKEALDQLQNERDGLYRVKRAKSCTVALAE